MRADGLLTSAEELPCRNSISAYRSRLNDYRLKAPVGWVATESRHAAEARSAARLALRNCEPLRLFVGNPIFDFVLDASIPKKQMLKAVRLKGGGFRPGDGD